MPSLEPAVCRVATEFPNRVDRLAALGDAVVPVMARWIGRRLLETLEFEDA
jgi:site-specific DNA-cytosine methylase